MTPSVQFRVIRLLSTWGLGVTLSALVGLSMVQGWRVHSAQLTEEIERAEDELERAALELELMLINQSRSWLEALESLESASDVAQRETRNRARSPFFDAFYVWTPGDSPAVDYPKSAQGNLSPETLAAMDRFRQAEPGPETAALTLSLLERLVAVNGEGLETTVSLLGEIVARVETLGPEYAEIVVKGLRAKDRVQKRLQGLRTVEGWQRESDTEPEIGSSPRFFYDPYGESSFVLAVALLGDGEKRGAVQIYEPDLLEVLLRKAGDHQPHMVIRNTEGERIAGSFSQDRVVANVPFPTLLPHLRLTYTEGYIARSQKQRFWQLLFQLLPALVAAFVGAVALAARSTADQHQRELARRQDEFTMRVTHELKTPLAGIRLMAENLEVSAPEEAHRIPVFSRRIVSEVERLNHRVEEILTLARSRRAAQHLPIALCEMLDTLTDSWHPRFSAAGITLHHHYEELGEIHGDPELLRDALACLLDNAIKYRNPQAELPQVWLSAQRQRRHIVIEVKDNGLGVPADRREAIFERFTRVEGPGRGKAGGHGLGLAFVQRAVTAHAGRVECTDGVDGGARFVVRLPVRRRWLSRRTS